MHLDSPIYVYVCIFVCVRVHSIRHGSDIICMYVRLACMYIFSATHMLCNTYALQHIRSATHILCNTYALQHICSLDYLHTCIHTEHTHMLISATHMLCNTYAHDKFCTLPYHHIKYVYIFVCVYVQYT